MVNISVAAEDSKNIFSFHLDRENETKKILEGLLSHNHNVLVYGEKGVGKTHLAKVVRANLNQHENIFLSYIPVPGLRSDCPNDFNKAFPKAVLLRLCVDIWREIFKGDILELQSQKYMLGRNNIFESKRRKMVREIYRYLITEQIVDQHTTSFSSGIKNVLESSVTENSSISASRASMLPFEILEYTEILSKNIFPHYDKEKVVVIFDDANTEPSSDQQEILETYLTLFQERNIQFMFVAGRLPWDSYKFVVDGFQTRINLTGFSDPDITSQFITRTLQGYYSISPSLCYELHQYYNGHPRKIQRCLIHSIEICEKNSTEQITDDIMNKAMLKIDMDLAGMRYGFKERGVPF